jgi:glycosyltransferase involved in cell wall biosynthesis
MSEGSSSAVYLGDYLGWDEARLARGYRRSRQMYRVLGIRDRLLALENVSRAYVFSQWARAINVRWGADPDKLDVVAPGFETPPPVDRGDRDGFRFLFVGTDFERKGGFDVVEAFDAVLADRPHVRLTIVSSNPATSNPDRLVHSWVGASRRNRLLARLEALRRSGHAEVYPLVGRETLNERFFPAADAFIMPTLAEGFGFTNVEAMSHALPVVSSRIGPVEEIITHRRTGLLVGAGAPGELRDAMAQLADDPGTACSMGADGRRDFLERFTLQRFQTALGQVYRRALER